MKTNKRIFAAVMSFILVISCFAVNASAAVSVKSMKITKLPDKTTFYKDVDWKYGYWSFPEGDGKGTFVELTDRKNVCFMHNGGYNSYYQDIGMLDMNGLVVEVTYSDGSKKSIEYKETISNNYAAQNIYASPTKNYHVGENTVEIYFLSNTAVYTSFKINILETSGPERLRGDVDGDGVVNSADALLALQHSVGLKTLTGDKFTAADLNADKTVNSVDAMIILKISVGQE